MFLSQSVSSRYFNFYIQVVVLGSLLVGWEASVHDEIGIKLSMKSSRSFSRAERPRSLVYCVLNCLKGKSKWCYFVVFVICVPCYEMSRCWAFFEELFFYLFGNKQLPSLFSKCLSFNETNVGISRLFFGHNCIWSCRQAQLQHCNSIQPFI